MTRKILIQNATLVLPEAMLRDAALVIEYETIQAICPAVSPRDARVVDLGGALVMPGMIDLHTDAIESEVEPRPGVMLPTPFAISQIDRRSAAYGLTTVYHSLSFSGRELGLRNDHLAAGLAKSIADHGERGCVDNRVHARYEVTNDAAIAILEPLLRDGTLSLLSLMDHTPGQGQFQTMASYHGYLAKRYNFDDDTLQTVIAEKLAASEGAWDRATNLITLAQSCGVPLASHDDDSAERVMMMDALGVRLCEFPVNLAAGEAIRTAGHHALVGSPNVFRGGSQSSGMRAIEAIDAGYADCLCSDYVPSTMLPAVWRVRRELGYDLPRAVALATLQPAVAVGLEDRGRIAEGMRADLLVVQDDDPYPRIVQTWSRGRCTYSTED